MPEPQTLDELSPGDFFVFLPESWGYRRYRFSLLRLLSCNGGKWAGNPTAQVFSATARRKADAFELRDPDPIMRVYPCKVCADAASKAGGVQRCECWSVT